MEQTLFIIIIIVILFTVKFIIAINIRYNDKIRYEYVETFNINIIDKEKLRNSLLAVYSIIFEDENTIIYSKNPSLFHNGFFIKIEFKSKKIIVSIKEKFILTRHFHYIKLELYSVAIRILRVIEQ